MEEERQEEEGGIASMSLLSAIQTKMGKKLGGHMYVEIEVEGKKFQAMVDTGVDIVYWQRSLPMRFVFLQKGETLCQGSQCKAPTYPWSCSG